METAPTHDLPDAVAPRAAQITTPVVNSTHLSRRHDDRVSEGTVYEGGVTPGDQLLAESQDRGNPVSLSNILNPSTNNLSKNKTADDMHAAESESVCSDLSTDAYRKNLTKDVDDALNLIRSTGSFAAFTPVWFGEQPRIAVDGVGDISIPLQEDQARQLINKARQAPFGKGSDTVVDTSIRNTWELDASQVQFSDPGDMARKIQGLCKVVADQMGITSPVSAEFYKTLIYEKGAMFKAHTDTEKIPGMFGTMILCLPSPHEGGDLVVKHRGARKVFKTSEGKSDLSPWPAGTRTCRMKFCPSRLAIDGAITRDLRHTLRRWIQKAASPDFNPQTDHGRLWYELEHEYTEANLSLRALKGTDLLRVQCLKELATELGLEVFLAMIKKEEEGIVESDSWWMRDNHKARWFDSDRDEESMHDLDEVLSTTISIPKLVKRFREDWVKDGEPLDNFTSHGEEGYSGYMGNSAPTATHWHCQTVALIFPNQKLADEFLVRNTSKSDAQSLPPRYLQKCKDPRTREQSIRTLEKMAKSAWEPTKKKSQFDYSLVPERLDRRSPTEVLRLAIDLHNYGFFNNVVGWLGANVSMLVYSHVKDKVLDPGNYAGFREIKAALQHNILLHSVGDRYGFLKSLAVESHNPCFGDVQRLSFDVVARSLDECQTSLPGPGEWDGLAAVGLVLEYHNESVFQDRFVPILRSRISLTSFIFGALEGYLENAEDNEAPRALSPTSLQVVEDIAKSAIAAMDLSKLLSEDTYKTAAAGGRQKLTAEYYRKALVARVPLPVVIASRLITPAMLETFVENCLRYRWDNVLLQFCFKIVAHADDIPEDEFSPVWVPFLASFIETFQTRGIDLSSPRSQQLGSAILDSYLSKYLGKEPTQDLDYSRPRLRTSCVCADCTQLNHFLVSPTRNTLRIPAPKKRRQHLHNMLDADGRGRCSHQTDRSTRPETLVIEKYGWPTDQPKQAWRDRAAAILKEIGKFDQDGLRKILGPDTCNYFKDAAHLSRHPALARIADISSLTAAPAPAVAGTKRTMPSDAEAGWNTRPY
ncbi:hypothetical protein QBC37DRAFT_386003 [Rhypophila decipiens]|uniref:Uncharacterized protein n=1 Tax=Rhypophila decipiens TaxID=261697 RepID=A0AAN7B9G0_9PEZI|nr:hypothetical protein QBC37DRAFT_386003 [Rhypophila decipiens]